MNLFGDPAPWRPSLENGNGFTLPSFVEMDRVQALLESLHRVIKIPIGLVDPDNTVRIAVGWQPICMHYHRGHPESRFCCEASNRDIQSRLVEGEITGAKCKNGLWDLAMPIMVGSNHLATLYIGQFLYEDETLDMEFFTRQAERYGYDMTGYLDAVRQVPRLSREQVRVSIEYTASLVGLLAELGFKNQQLAEEVRERRLTEYALNESEKQYRALVENVPGAVYLCLNDDAYTTIFISDAIESIIGVPGKTLINESAPLAALIHPEDLPAVQREVDEAVMNKQAYVATYRMRRKDGSYTWVEERGQGVWDDAGELRFLQGVIFDASERKRLEEERRSLEEHMARAQQIESLGILAGGIAHDFNNLLVGILGNADLALCDTLPDQPAYESIRAIVAAARRAAELTRQMLAYSGKGHFLMEPADISALVARLTPFLEETYGDKAVFKYELSREPLWVSADIAQMRQLLLNLIANAVESYGEQPGVVTIRTGERYCDAAFLADAYHHCEHFEEGMYCCIEVEDQGCGMDAQTQQRLCDPFFSTKFAGRGLGMAVVLGITRGHKGLIALNSAPGKGTSIQVLFPIKTPANKAMPSAQAQPSRNAVGRILLIDDEPIVRNVAKKMLERAGFQVLAAHDGARALELLQAEDGAIDCIILDLTMPNMDGEGTLRAIRAVKAAVPVILSSGHSREEAVARMEGLNIAAFLQKPYKMSTLTNLLRRVLS